MCPNPSRAAMRVVAEAAATDWRSGYELLAPNRPQRQLGLLPVFIGSDATNHHILWKRRWGRQLDRRCRRGGRARASKLEQVRETKPHHEQLRYDDQKHR